MPLRSLHTCWLSRSSPNVMHHNVLSCRLIACGFRVPWFETVICQALLNELNGEAWNREHERKALQECTECAYYYKSFSVCIVRCSRRGIFTKELKEGETTEKHRYKARVIKWHITFAALQVLEFICFTLNSTIEWKLALKFTSSWLLHPSSFYWLGLWCLHSHMRGFHSSRQGRWSGKWRASSSFLAGPVMGTPTKIQWR